MAINHLLHDADWARARLQRFAGRTVRFESASFSANLIVAADGYLQPADARAETATVVRVGPAVLTRLLLSRDWSPGGEIKVEGDAAFASAITGVLSGLRWDIEEDLSHLVGDVAGRRLAQGASELLRWQAEAASNLAHALVEYWTEEQPVIVSGDAQRRFLAFVDALRDDAERLEKRIERLACRVNSRAHS